mgnify:CR=1 FL=1
MKISIVIVTHNREALLKECLNSIVKQLKVKGLKASFETIVVFNGGNKSELDQREILCLTSYNIRKSSPSSARNFAIKKCSGEYILFIDDDTKLCSNYLLNSLNFIDEYRPDIFGGSDKEYSNSGIFERSINFALRSPLVTAQTSNRHNQNIREHFQANEKHLTLSNLWFKSSLFKQGHQFNPHFYRNEENILISQIAKHSALIFFVPKLCVEHRRRSKLKNFFYPSYYSGYYRMKTFFNYPTQFSLVFILPVICLVISPLLLLMSPYLLGSLALIYLCLLTFFTLKISLSNQSYKCIIPLFFLQPIILISYSLGSLVSILLNTGSRLLVYTNTPKRKSNETPI